MSKIPSLKGTSPGVLAATQVVKDEAKVYRREHIVADPCPVNGVHHWLIEQERRKGLIVGECKYCLQPWPQERGKLEQIADVTPSEYRLNTVRMAPSTWPT